LGDSFVGRFSMLSHLFQRGGFFHLGKLASDLRRKAFWEWCLEGTFLVNRLVWSVLICQRCGIDCLCFALLCFTIMAKIVL
jgi:hypothetical protein